MLPAMVKPKNVEARIKYFALFTFFDQLIITLMRLLLIALSCINYLYSYEVLGGMNLGLPVAGLSIGL